MRKTKDEDISANAYPVNLMAYSASAAGYLCEFNGEWAKALALDKEVSQAQRKALLKDQKWTKEVLMYLLNAGRCWKGFVRAINIVLQYLDSKVSIKEYDNMNKDTNLMISYQLLLMNCIDENEGAAEEIREYLLNFGGGTPPIIRQMSDHFFNKSK